MMKTRTTLKEKLSSCESVIPATKDDSANIAELIDIAGEGLPRTIWKSYAPPGIDPIIFGAERAALGSGNFSWRNVNVIRNQQGVTGMVLAYRLPDSPPDFSGLHPLELPLVKLEARVPGSFYINALAVYPVLQGQGYGRRLMHHAHQLSRTTGCKQTALIVFSNNTRARRLYQSMGYEIQASEPAIDAPGFRKLGECQLMIRQAV
jgi:ribosomal protein S18 acetylase RimI-like enzyme